MVSKFNELHPENIAKCRKINTTTVNAVHQVTDKTLENWPTQYVPQCDKFYNELREWIKSKGLFEQYNEFLAHIIQELSWGKANKAFADDLVDIGVMKKEISLTICNCQSCENQNRVLPKKL